MMLSLPNSRRIELKETTLDVPVNADSAFVGSQIEMSQQKDGSSRRARHYPDHFV